MVCYFIRHSLSLPHYLIVGSNPIPVAMSRFINPFTDIGFKIIFGSEMNKDVLIQFLNALLDGEHVIEDLKFLDKENNNDNIHDQIIIYDIYCRTSTGEYIIVEMQNAWHCNFLDRTLYYVCRSIAKQQHKPVNKYGENYKIASVYGIFLMNFREGGLPARSRIDTVVADRETGVVINNHFRQIYLQFPYFNKELSECETLFDKFMYTLKNMDNWDRMPAALKEQVFERLAHLAERANLSEADQIAYDKAVDSYRVSSRVMQDHYELGLEEGIQKGVKKGRAEGIEEGIQKGKAEGIEEGEHLTNLKNATNMKHLGVSPDIISQVTGLTKEEIESL